MDIHKEQGNEIWNIDFDSGDDLYYLLLISWDILEFSSPQDNGSHERLASFCVLIIGHFYAKERKRIAGST